MTASSHPPSSSPEPQVAPDVQAGMRTRSDPAATILTSHPAAKPAIPAAQDFERIGPYRVLSKLGEGAMGAVYLGHDDERDRPVAIKVLPRQFAGKAELVSRFRREATAAGTLRHANIIAAFRAGDDDGVHYYSMEYCAGESLAQALERRGPFTLEAVLPIMLQIVSGLEHAHAHGFVHRDIKPSNLMVTRAGVAKILDLGLTKNIDDAQASFNTMTGMAMGTPHYISPEQARGEKDIDGRADIYSLGATLYHLLAGRTPFEGSTPAVIMTQHLTREPPDLHRLLPDLPLGAVYVVRRMMAKAPAQRYADCAALRTDLELLITGKLPGGMLAAHAVKNRSNPRVQPAEKRPRRARPLGMVVAVVAAGVVLLAAGGVVLTAGRANSPRAPDPHQAAPALAASPRVEQTSPPPAQPGLPASVAPVPAPAVGVAPAPAAPGPVQATTAAGTSADAWELSLQGKPAQEQLAAVTARLKELNPGFHGTVTADYRDGAVTALTFSSVAITDLSPLRALHGLKALSCTGDWEHRTLTSLAGLKGLHLERLSIGYSKIDDLSPLIGMPLTYLFAENGLISDLSPLRAMKLEQLFLSGCPNEDMSPLRGMPLHHVHCGSKVRDLSPLSGMHLYGLAIWATQVADLGPLAGMPIDDYVYMSNNNVSDLRPLAGAGIHRLIFTPKNIRTGIEVVRAMTSLTEIGVDWDKSWPTAEFWKRYDAGEFGTPLASAPAPPPPSAPPAAALVTAPAPAPAPARSPGPAPAAKATPKTPAGTVLVQETFDSFNLASPPTLATGRWWPHGGLSLVAEPGHGKVLKVVQQDSTSFSGIHFAIDGNLVAGKTLMVTVAAKFPGTYTPVPSLAWKRPRLNVNGTSRSGAALWSLMTIFPEPMRPDWQLLTATAVMPQDLASLEIYLETQVAAEVYFDNFGIALIDPKAP